jgi:hypothetical protein
LTSRHDLWPPSPGPDLDTDPSQESRVHDRLLQRWGVHGTCLRVHVRRIPARAHCRYVVYCLIISSLELPSVCTVRINFSFQVWDLEHYDQWWPGGKAPFPPTPLLIWISHAIPFFYL